MVCKQAIELNAESFFLYNKRLFRGTQRVHAMLFSEKRGRNKIAPPQYNVWSVYIYLNYDLRSAIFSSRGGQPSLFQTLTFFQYSMH